MTQLPVQLGQGQIRFDPAGRTLETGQDLLVQRDRFLLESALAEHAGQVAIGIVVVWFELDDSPPAADRGSWLAVVQVELAE